MKRILLILLACLVSVPALAGEPRILVEKNDFDFGQIFEGQKVEHSFRFQNSGDEPLIIDRVRSSCGCTAALPSAKIVAAGDVAELKTTFDSNRFSGAVVKTIYLYTNDPRQQVTELYLRGTVKRELVLTPARLDVPNLAVGVPREIEVRIANQSQRAITLSDLQTTTPEIRAELSAEQIAPGRESILKVRITPKEGGTRLSGYVLLKTSSEYASDLRLPVYGAVAAAKAP